MVNQFEAHKHFNLQSNRFAKLIHALAVPCIAYAWVCVYLCWSILKYQYSNERKKTANEIPQFVRLIFHVCYFQLLVCLFDHCKHFWMSCNKIDCLSIYNVFNVYILPAIVPAQLRFIFKYTGLSQRRRGTVRLYFAFFPKMLWFLPFCASFSLFPLKMAKLTSAHYFQRDFEQICKCAHAVMKPPQCKTFKSLAAFVLR